MTDPGRASGLWQHAVRLRIRSFEVRTDNMGCCTAKHGHGRDSLLAASTAKIM